MWCTRWYLPLLLLPLPTAPPFFLLLFLLSLTMHAKPCFYCVVLLSTLFVSSCYWQPFPMSNPLSKPWDDNITTFADALNASLPHINQPLPSVMHVVDRCWCDFSPGGFFEPFNVSRWEHVSIDRFVADLVRRQEAEETTEQDLVHNTTFVTAGEPTQVISAPPTNSPSAPTEKRNIWSAVQTFTRQKLASLLPSDQTPLQPSYDPPSTVPSTTAQEKVSFFRREYDLRPYGLDMIIDFGWTR